MSARHTSVSVDPSDPIPQERETVARAAPRGSIAHSLRALVHARDLPVLLVLVVIVGGVSIFHPTYLSKASLINTAQFASYIGCMSIGAVFLLSMREIDLSVGAVYGLSAIIAAKFMGDGVNPWIAALLALVAGTSCGLFNGLVANVLRIQTIVVTLGTLSMLSALSLIISGDQVLVNVPTQSSFFRILGRNYLTIPVSIWTLLILGILGHILYRHTRFGAHVRLIGSNPEAARLLGLPIGRLRVSALMLQSFLCATIGVITLGYLQSADPTSGVGYELSVIAAAIVGGTALAGGQGSVIGAVIGALIISAISTGLVQFGVSPDWGGFATGAIIIGAVTMDAFIRRRRLAIRLDTREAKHEDGIEAAVKPGQPAPASD
jgi:ribose transport system permease protein